MKCPACGVVLSCHIPQKRYECTETKCQVGIVVININYHKNKGDAVKPKPQKED